MNITEYNLLHEDFISSYTDVKLYIITLAHAIDPDSVSQEGGRKGGMNEMNEENRIFIC